MASLISLTSRLWWDYPNFIELGRDYSVHNRNYSIVNFHMPSQSASLCETVIAHGAFMRLLASVRLMVFRQPSLGCESLWTITADERTFARVTSLMVSVRSFGAVRLAANFTLESLALTVVVQQMFGQVVFVCERVAAHLADVSFVRVAPL